MVRDIQASALRLLEPLYDAALGQVDWAAFLDPLTTAMQGDVGVLALIDVGTSAVEFVAQTQVPEPMRRQYAERFLAIDPWPAAFQNSGLPYGTNGCSQDFVSMRDFARGEYYNEFWRPNGDLFHTCGGFLEVDTQRIAMFAVPRSRRRTAYTATHAALMDLLSPHVGKALQLQQRLAHVERGARDMEAVLDRMGDAIFVVDATGRILCANWAADAELATHARLTSRHGCLATLDHATDVELKTAIHAAAGTASARTLTCRQSIMLRGAGSPQGASITCYPLTARQQDVSRWPVTARVLVVVSDSARTPRQLATMLRALYGLTPTEALIAEGIAQGGALEEVATMMRMSTGTARIHLKHVFAKTDTCRQGQLVALIHRIVPVALLRE